MKAQLPRPAKETHRPGRTLQVLPFGAGEYGSMGSAFSLLTFPEPPTGRGAVNENSLARMTWRKSTRTQPLTGRGRGCRPTAGHGIPSSSTLPALR
ncbi:Scr1 family TA system antitoxin-like transcriptional regulator [Micromonospora sp. 15K316]|uniref:Scr1 family TA system antitoxin-like transcriptional regulator n=1 Tax=Micromonospora sp. 15K316 TaxID=2530376 RepID=UPI001FB5F8F8|nr:Scr1 family TA system antitoxin-like transcriptional regulator [Micromonospora sp. 15K316]